jgi:hypothetical protein
MLRLDGNAVAGLLAEIYGRDVTSDVGTCDACGAHEPLGAVHVYRSAGVTLRCPHCDAVLMCVVARAGQMWFHARGLRTLEVTRRADRTAG